MADAITVQRSDDASIGIALSNPDGSPYDAAGASLTFNVVKSAGAAPLISKVINSFTNGGSEATISLTEADLTQDVRVYKYELILVDTTGKRRSSGLNSFYITENDGQPGTVNVQVGSAEINVAVTLAQTVDGAGVDSVNGRDGEVVLTSADVGLDQVDNTSDANKPVSTAQEAALDAKADVSSLAPVATSGRYIDLSGLPTIPTQYTNAMAQSVALAAIAATTLYSNKTLTSPTIDVVKDSNGASIMSYTTVASAVNYLDVKDNATGFSPTLSAAGSDANIDINLVPKGTGRVRVNGVLLPTTTSNDTFTNKAMSGSSNTFSNIPESAITNLGNDLASREPAVSAGTPAQYYRGDKTFQTLDTSVVPENGNLYFTNARADARIALQAGVIGGFAPLDSTTKIPSAYLPSYVDDVVEVSTFSALPATGSSIVIYVTLDTNKIYRWGGSSYVEISPSPGSTDSVPEGSVNLYYTTARATTAATAAITADTTHVLKAGDTMTGNLTTPRLLVNSTAYIDGSTAGTLSITGKIVSAAGASGFTLQDATTNTKQAQFDASLIAAATTRTYQLPNRSAMLAPYTNPVTSSEFYGLTAGGATVTGGGNTGIGYQSLLVVTSGGSNTSIGNGAMKANISGSYNVAVGEGTLGAYTGSSGGANVAIGRNTLSALVTGDSNTGFGAGAGSALNSASNNLLIGANAGNNLITGSGNIIIGAGSTAPSSSSTGMLVIGSDTAAMTTAYIGRGSTSTTAAPLVLQNSNRTGTDVAAGNLTIASGAGAGAGAASSISFQTPTVGSSGTTQQTLASRITITSTTTSVYNALSATGGLTSSANSALTGSLTLGLATNTAAITLTTASKSIQPCNATTAAFTLTLPTAVGNVGLTFTIKKVDSTTNAITIASGGGTIDGGTTYLLSTQYKYVEVVSDGTNWLVIGNN